MKVIAKGYGPRINDDPSTEHQVGSPSLTPGKEYEVIEIASWNADNSSWVIGPMKYNPDKAQFYIRIHDDSGKLHDIWNDYFEPTSKLRNNKLQQLGV